MGKMDTNLMSVQTERKKVVRLTFPKLKDGMLRQKMLREEDP
jgi:hypothetical protein